MPSVSEAKVIRRLSHDFPGVKLLPLQLDGKMVKYSTGLRSSKVKDAPRSAGVVRVTFNAREGSKGPFILQD